MKMKHLFRRPHTKQERSLNQPSLFEQAVGFVKFRAKRNKVNLPTEEDKQLRSRSEDEMKSWKDRSKAKHQYHPKTV